MKYSILTVLVFVLFSATLRAQSRHQLQREGDRQYEKSKYREAEQAYRQAGKDKSSTPDVAYNTGNAVYQQGNYSASEQLFEQAAKTAKDPKLQADALHNLGNAYLKQQKFKEAVGAYEKSLRNRPGDPDTKVNLQLAKKKWQQQQEQQQKKNQQQQNQSSDQKPNDQKKQDKDKPKNQPKQNSSNQQNQSEQQKQEQNQASDGRMTKDQARRLLERAVAPEDQRNARKYREMEPGKHRVKPKKDW